jgi:hypothetical protein
MKRLKKKKLINKNNNKNNKEKKFKFKNTYFSHKNSWVEFKREAKRIMLHYICVDLN